MNRIDLITKILKANQVNKPRYQSLGRELLDFEGMDRLVSSIKERSCICDIIPSISILFFDGFDSPRMSAFSEASPTLLGVSTALKYVK